MKTFLSVKIDDEGKMHFDSDYRFKKQNNPQSQEEFDSLVRAAIKSLSKCMWKDRNFTVSSAIRLLSMAEAAASDEPYKSAEEYWSTMLFDFLPHYESFFNKVKKRYGIDTVNIVRPLTFGKWPNVKDGIGLMPLN